LAAILRPLVNLKGQQDAKRDDSKFDSNADPITIANEIAYPVKPCGRALFARRGRTGVLYIGHAVAPLGP
jgi:hypothetical protein